MLTSCAHCPPAGTAAGAHNDVVGHGARRCVGVGQRICDSTGDAQQGGRVAVRLLDPLVRHIGWVPQVPRGASSRTGGTAGTTWPTRGPPVICWQPA